MITPDLPLANSADNYDNSYGSGFQITTKSRQAGMIIHDRERWAHMAGAAPEGNIK